MSKERRWPLMALGLMLGCSTGTLSHSVDETSPSGDGSRTDTTVQRDGGATDLATPTDAVSLPDLPPLECREDEQCSAKAPRTDCIGGRCVEPAGRVQCRDDDHCAGSPATPRCWAGVCIAKPPEQRITAAPNTWTKIEQSDSGGRTGPIFAYVPQIDRYVVSTGVPRSTKHSLLRSRLLRPTAGARRA